MAGKLCNGVFPTAGDLRTSKSYCEGMHFRAQGKASEYPESACPHPTGEVEERLCWLAGWDAADSAAGSTISEAVAGCCAEVGVAVGIDS